MKHTMLRALVRVGLAPLASGAFAVFSLIMASLSAGQAAPTIGCEALDNGKRAAATFRAYRDGAQIAAGICGRDVEVAEGPAELLIQLDGVLGGEAQKQAVQAQPGAVARAKASFETGELLIEVTREGRRSTAIAQLRAGTQTIGRLSAGVATRLSVGTYSLAVESRGEQRQLDGVTISRGERRVLGVEFGAPPK